jgi:hypothetical protein
MLVEVEHLLLDILMSFVVNVALQLVKSIVRKSYA